MGKDAKQLKLVQMEINKLKVNKIFIYYTLIYVYMERRKTDVFHDVMCLTTTIMEEMRIKKKQDFI